LAYHLVLNKDPRARDANAALPLALKAIEQTPGAGNTWNTLGVVYYRHGDWDKAIEAMNKATSLRGEYAGDMLFIAMAYARKNDWPRAREWFERARHRAKMQPRDMEVQQFLAEADELLAKAPKE
jgi:tetratricopeptide (TPR) repeat protein